jgi:hypothetical protein
LPQPARIARRCAAFSRSTVEQRQSMMTAEFSAELDIVPGLPQSERNRVRKSSPAQGAGVGLHPKTNFDD